MRMILAILLILSCTVSSDEMNEPSFYSPDGTKYTIKINDNEINMVKNVYLPPCILFMETDPNSDWQNPTCTKVRLNKDRVYLLEETETEIIYAVINEVGE